MRNRYLYEKDIDLKIKDNKNLFWSYVLSKANTKVSVCKLDMGNGELCSNEKETPGVLNNYFASVFKQESDQELQTPRNMEMCKRIGHL